MKSLDCFVVALNLGVTPLQDVLKPLVSTVSKDTITDSEYADIVESMLFRISSYSTLSPASNEPLAGAWKLTVTYGRGRKVRKEACRIKKKQVIEFIENILKETRSLGVLIFDCKCAKA